VDPWLIWVLAGLLLVGAEMVLPGAFLLWIGMAAVGTGLIVTALAPSFPMAVVVFVLLLAAGVVTGLLNRRAATRADLNTPESGLVGRAGVVLTAEGPGLRVRVGDGDWAAEGETPGIAPGAPVTVTGVTGTTLRVRANPSMSPQG